MKKIICILLCIFLTGCQSKLPLPEKDSGIRGEMFEIDKNINEATIDNYLNRKDSVYYDMRMLKDEANYEAIGGDSYLSGYIKGFEVLPFPYICNPVGLPEEVGNSYSGKTLFTLKDGIYTANYKESEDIINKYFPKDKNIFLICGGGGYAYQMKQLLLFLGYDANKIYNVGGFWYYEGKNAISTKQEDGTYDFSSVVYHQINFDALNPLNVQETNNNVNITDRNETNIKQLFDLNSLVELENKRENFLLLVYLNGCSACASFKPVVEEFAKSEQLPIYSISLELIKTHIPEIKYTPSLVVFKEGQMLDYLDAKADEDIDFYRNAYNLSKWISEYFEIDLINGEAENDPSCEENACTLS
ncbi:MAG: thioredoxin family protein [Erysipelotrichaceae bacterium]|nr:thioredoxin family protein [Erysipelotrichaceae bacterium]